jgi:hypothetical protein
VYSITEPEPIAQDQIAALPLDAVRYLAEVFALLETAPWAGKPSNPAKPDGNLRNHALRDGRAGDLPRAGTTARGLHRPRPAALDRIACGVRNPDAASGLVIHFVHAARRCWLIRPSNICRYPRD